MSRKIKKMKRRLLILNVLLVTLFILLLFTVVFFAGYKEVFRPAYYSTALKCFTVGDLIVQEKGGAVQGQLRVTGNTNATISIFVDDPENEVLKHEIIHLRQFEQGRLSQCGLFGIASYLNEVEAYLFDGLPDPIYKKLYGDFEAL
jgi:hypothetical protein